MLELSLLGLHALRGPGGRELTSLPAQSKRFALLAYLALGARGGYHRRDTLAAMFWPDMDQFAARRALRNTLYHLREALGDNVVVTRGDDAVSINPAMLTCDVTLLQDDVAAGRLEEAIDRYHGELLAGFHVPHAGEALEEWLLTERRRVAAVVIQAIRTLIERDEQRGDLAKAAYWAQRACTLAPGDESWLLRAMALCDDNGDTGSALRLYETFTRQLATEFKATPSAECRALAAQIQRGTRTKGVASAGLHQPRVEPRVAGAAMIAAHDNAHHALAAPSPVPSPPTTAMLPPAAPIKRTGSSRRRMIGLGAVLVIGTVAMIALVARHKPRDAAAHQRALITVFDNRTGDSTLQSLGRMTQDWLAQGLMRTNLIDVVDPRAVYVQSQGRDAASDPMTLAHRTGAAVIVSGAYYRLADTLLFQATVTDVRTGRIIRVVGPIRSNVATPVAALDELRSRVMTALATAVDAHGTQGLTRNTELPPFDVYQAYVAGWDAYWHGDGPRAEALFLDAAHRDSAFTAAALATATVAANLGTCPLVDSVTAALDARATPLDQVDQLSLEVAGARCHGRNDEMLRLTLQRADLDPGNSGEQMSAANAALWANRPARALAALQRINPSTDLGWSTDTTHFAYFNAVAEALHQLGRHQEELAATNRVPAGAPLGRAWLRGSAFAALSRPTAALTLLDSALTLPVETATSLGLAPYTSGRPEYTMTPGWVANWLAREFAVHGDTVASRQAAARGIAWYRARPAAERDTPEERLIEASSLEILTRYQDAEHVLRQLLADDSTNADYRGELGGLAAESGDTVLANTVDTWLAAQLASRVGWSASIYRARIAALLGRDDDAMARLRDAFDAGIWPRWLDQEPALIPLRRRADFIALTTPKP